MIQSIVAAMPIVDDVQSVVVADRVVVAAADCIVVVAASSIVSAVVVAASPSAASAVVAASLFVSVVVVAAAAFVVVGRYDYLMAKRSTMFSVRHWICCCWNHKSYKKKLDFISTLDMATNDLNDK
jgi:hypothetical protein